jgi:hypothetical protein
MLTQDSFIKSQLVCAGWRYGTLYGGGHLAGTMVMCAIANRVRAGWGSWLQVLDRLPAFAAEKDIPPIVYPSLWEPNFVKMLHAVEGIYSGSATDLTQGQTVVDNKPKSGGLYFGMLNKIERPWFKEFVIDAINPATGLKLHNRVADMNSLSFWD